MSQVLYKLFALFLIVGSSMAFAKVDYLSQTTVLGYGEDEILIQRARKINSPIINKALMIRDFTALSNYSDVRLLMKAIKKSGMDSTLIVNKALRKIDRDRQIINSYHRKIDGNHFYPFALRSNIDLIVEQDLFLTAHDLIKTHGKDLCNGILRSIPFHNDLTKLKTALIYLYLASNKSAHISDEFIRSLALFYPIKLEQRHLYGNAAKLGVFDPENKVLWIPHSGYVINGDPINGYFRGTDCSGLISIIFNSERHYSTKELSLMSRFLANDISLADWIAGYIKNEAKNYELITNSDNLKPGDIVIWRWPIAPIDIEGHVAFFIEWTDKAKGEFSALEAALIPEENIEGIGARVLNIKKQNTKTFFLRRRHI